MNKPRSSSLRFVSSLEHEVIDWLLNFIVRYFCGKILDFTIKRSWSRVRQFVSRLTWFFPAGIGVLTLQVLTGLGYVSPPTTYVPILDQAVFVLVTYMGLLLIGLGMSMGGPRRSFNGILIVGSRYPVRVSKNRQNLGL